MLICKYFLVKYCFIVTETSGLGETKQLILINFECEYVQICGHFVTKDEMLGKYAQPTDVINEAAEKLN